MLSNFWLFAPIEAGIANLALFPKVVEQYRRDFVQSQVIMTEGKLYVEGKIIHMLVRQTYNITFMLIRVALAEHLKPATPLPTLSRADEPIRGDPKDARVLKVKQVISGSRGFK